MSRGFWLTAAAVLAWGPAASPRAAAAECENYARQALKIVGEVQNLFKQTLEQEISTDKLRCQFTGTEWSIREQRHRDWCSALPAAEAASAIGRRLQKMSEEARTCRADVTPKLADAARNKPGPSPEDGSVAAPPPTGGAAMPPQPPSAPVAALPPQQPPDNTEQIAAPREQIVHFSKLEVGALQADAFGSVGVGFVQGNGAPGIYRFERNMVLPPGRKQVLLVAGERTTSLTIVFKTPIRRFSLTRIGTAGGASVPTWTLEAFDRAGNVVGSTGEEHGLPPTPQQFSIDGNGIVRVVLNTDNRYGEGTWATWNSLPVAEFEFTR